MFVCVFIITKINTLPTCKYVHDLITKLKVYLHIIRTYTKYKNKC